MDMAARLAVFPLVDASIQPSCPRGANVPTPASLRNA
jgi:hypothetical protein